MNRKILLVDDEPAVVQSFQRQLRKKYEVDIAIGGFEGLKSINSRGPYAVIVSDYQMPGIDGIRFLATAREKTPDSVRVMLTGQADLQTAIDAVNEGHIFRFLTKPCPEETLTRTLEAGIEMYRLITAERELLEKTLSGSVKVLTEILGLVNPTAFGRAIRIKSCVNHMVSELNIPHAWQFELAALLSMIGCVTLPPDTLERVYAGTKLAGDEQAMFDKHPVVARDLLVNIPRLGTVARMIEAQGQMFTRRTESEVFEGEDMVALGGHLLKIAMDFDRLFMQGKPQEDIVREMSNDPDQYFTEAVKALENFEVRPVDMVERSVTVRQLHTGMILNGDVVAKNKSLIAIKGQDVTYTMLERLRSFARSVGINEPLMVIEKKQIAD